MHPEMHMASADRTAAAQLPERRFLTRSEAAAWLRVSVDTFLGFGIPYCDLGPRCRRWDLLDIVAFVSNTKTGDSARTPARQRKGQTTCKSTNEKAHPTGGRPGMTRTASDIAEVLELPIKS